jgi:hypothetical protein
VCVCVCVCARLPRAYRLQVTAADIAAEQAREAQVDASLDDLARLQGEAVRATQALADAVHAHYERLLMAGSDDAAGGSGGLPAGGQQQGPPQQLQVEGLVEALHNLYERLDLRRPQAGTVASVLAQMQGGW